MQTPQRLSILAAIQSESESLQLYKSFFLRPSSLFFFPFSFFHQETLTPNKELNKRRERQEAVSKCRGVFLKRGEKALTSRHTHVVSKLQHNSTPLFPPPCYNRTTNTDVKKKKTKHSLKKKKSDDKTMLIYNIRRQNGISHEAR